MCETKTIITWSKWKTFNNHKKNINQKLIYILKTKVDSLLYLKINISKIYDWANAKLLSPQLNPNNNSDSQVLGPIIV